MTYAFRLAAALVLALSATTQAQSPPSPPRAEGVELSPPQTVTRPGYCKVTAKAEGEVNFDVEAQFEDADADFHFDRLDPKTLIVAVPDSRGVIRVSAWRVPGKPGDALARTYVVVNPGKPAPAPAPAPGPPPPSPAAAPARVDAFIVIDGRSPDQGPGRLATSPSLRDAVHARGGHLHVLSATSAVIASQNLSEALKAAGGPPALVVVADKQVVWKGKLPAAEAEVLAHVPEVKK